MSNVRAVLVDPHQRTISQIEVDEQAYFEQIRSLIEAQSLDVVAAETFFGGQGRAVIYVDDEGLLVDPSHQAFSLVGSKVLAGKFVVLREIEVPLEDEDDDGLRRVDVDFSLEAVRDKVAFCNARFAAAALEMGLQQATAYYISRGLHVERAGSGLIVTGPRSPAGPPAASD